MKKLICVLSVAALVLALAPALMAGEDGKALFDAKCAMCHGKDGVAKPMAKGSKNFNDPAFQKEMSADAIVKVTTDGKGEKMKPFKDKLTGEQIKAVAEYIKSMAPAK
jgi:mono/diheme cytochrome c family protein